MNILKALYRDFFKTDASVVAPIAGSGSARRYYRLVSEAGSAIGVAGVDAYENATFIYLAEVLRRHGVSVPQIYAVSQDSMAYLQQDLGDASLFSLLNSDNASGLVRQVMELLPDFQFCPGIDNRRLYPVSVMDGRHVMWDLNYFKYCFLKPAGVSFDENGLETDFQNFTSSLLDRQPFGLMYRDCQSRNVMYHGGQLWWIDFQSARRGPVLYDLASFLWQAKAGFSTSFRHEMSEVYLERLCHHIGMDIASLRSLLPEMVLFRTLQVLGAYGLRGLTERKAHFVESIPSALSNADELQEQGVLDAYPSLKAAIKSVVALPRFHKYDSGGKLVVSVFSFSYKKGYPEDLSGNGGGFMFDCRSLHNPGRYEQYKPLTGRDAAVCEFLENRGEIQPFLQNAWALTDPAIERYISRGFSSLQIGFGCTGGRHRSVYSADATARHIEAVFGDRVIVRLEHREQDF